LTGLLSHRAGWFLAAITVLVCLGLLASNAPPASWAHGSLLPIGLVLLVLAWEADAAGPAGCASRHSLGPASFLSSALLRGSTPTVSLKAHFTSSTPGMTHCWPWSVLIWLAFPVLLVLSVALAGSDALPLAGGALVLISSVIAFHRQIVDSRIATLAAVRIVAVVLVAVRMIPFDLEAGRPALAGTVLGIAGGTVLVASFSIGRTVLPSQAVFGFLLAAFAPDQPLSAALFPIVAAAIVLLNRRRDLAMLAITVVLAIFCGRWAYPFVAFPLMGWALARVLARREGAGVGGHWLVAGGPMFPAGWLRPWAATHLARVVPMFPNALASIPRDLPFLLSASGLLIVAGFVRPAVAVMYVLIVVGATLAFARPHSENLAFPSWVIASIVILFLGWSGAFGSLAFFPLPLPAVPLLSALAICLLPIVSGNRWPAAIAAVALCVLGASYGPSRAADEVHVLARSLRAGEAMAVDTGTARSRVAVVAWALNGAGLNPESRLGTIEFLDNSGSGFRRNIRVSDVPDWGSFRRSLAFYSKNSWPTRPAGRISGVGPGALVTGAGLVDGKLPDGRRISLIRVTADSGLPPGSSLQVQEVHFAASRDITPAKRIRP